MASKTSTQTPDRGGKLPQDSEQLTLLSGRTLLIIILSVATALVVGVAAGIPAGIAGATAMGLSGGILAGLLTGLASAIVGGISTAASLNSLLTNRPSR